MPFSIRTCYTIVDDNCRIKREFKKKSKRILIYIKLLQDRYRAYKRIFCARVIGYMSYICIGITNERIVLVLCPITRATALKSVLDLAQFNFLHRIQKKMFVLALLRLKINIILVRCSHSVKIFHSSRLYRFQLAPEQHQARDLKGS